MPLTILNVDDDLVARYLLRGVLEKEGYKVLEAATGQEGLSLAPRANLVLLDVVLPDLNGFEVCRRLKADPATARIPVIQMSATFHDDEALQNGLQGGAEKALPRQVAPDTLLAGIRSLLGR
jgi:CheY-like chemotaxis protein